MNHNIESLITNHAYMPNEMLIILGEWFFLSF